MAFKLLEAAQGLITDELLSKAGSFSGESEGCISKAMGGILPSLVAGLADKVSSSYGDPQTVANLAAQAHNAGFLQHLESFFNGDNNSLLLLNKGTGMLSQLFSENKISALTNLISNFSGIKSSSAGSLLAMATPLVLGLLGKHAATYNINAAGLASVLHNQKAEVLDAVPPGLELGSVFSRLSKNTTYVTDSKLSTDQSTAHKTNTPDDGGFRWLLPLFLLLLIMIAAWYYLSKGCKGDNVISSASDSLKSKTTQIAALVAGKVDSLTGDFIYNPGQNVEIELPDGAGSLQVGENSTEYKLYTFLSDKNASVDTVKGNWFGFTNVHFKTGGAQIDSASMGQLKNIAAIIKAFPEARFKLGGYTDNTGDSVTNVALSQKRAEAVAAQLKQLGTAAASIAGVKGYGPQWPLADNETAEGRAMNRRVAVNVKAK